MAKYKALTGSAVKELSTSSPEKQIFVPNFDKLKCIVVSFGKQHRKSNAELSIQLLSASPNKISQVLLLDHAK